MRCYLFASPHTRSLTVKLSQAIERAGHQWRHHSVATLHDVARFTQLPDPVPDFADRPFLEWWSTHIYVAHLMDRVFGFHTGAPPFTAVQFIEHLRAQSEWCARAVFASCHAHGDVWPVLSDRVSLTGTDPVVPVLVCCKHDVARPLTDTAVLRWLSGLDWSSHLLGLPMNDCAVVVGEINMTWQWMLI